MASLNVLVLAALASLSFAPICLSGRLRDRIYRPIKSGFFCFRRTNGSQQFGCTSDKGGDVGVVHLIDSQQEAQWLEEHGQHAPYMAIFLPDTFHLLQRLADKNLLSGAILISTEEQERPEEGFSEDTVCPNEASSLYKGRADDCRADKRPWNPRGNAMLYADWKFPVFAVDDKDIADTIVKDCYEAFNKPKGDAGRGGEREERDWPLCAMELDAHMHAATSTETCIRRNGVFNLVGSASFCDPMGDRNSFLYLKERNEANKGKKVILVTARLDSANLFNDIERGSDSPGTGITALLETARLLNSNPPNFGGEVGNVLFALFHGEAFDYIGSSRFVYDLKEGLFPNKMDEEKFEKEQQPVLKLDDLAFVVELGQLRNVEASPDVFLHTDARNPRKTLLSDLVTAARRQGLLMSLSSEETLPPASAQSFLKEKVDLPTIFVSDFDRQFTNKYYHSIMDDSQNLGFNYTVGREQPAVARVGGVAASVAEFVYEKASSNDAQVPNFRYDGELVSEVLHCYTDTARCPAFKAASNAGTPPLSGPAPPYPWSMYVGVDRKPQWHGIMTSNLAVLLTGREVAPPEGEDHVARSDCRTPPGQNVRDRVFLRGWDVPSWWEGDKESCDKDAECGLCYETLGFRRTAVSPAFVIEK